MTGGLLWALAYRLVLPRPAGGMVRLSWAFVLSMAAGAGDNSLVAEETSTVYMATPTGGADPRLLADLARSVSGTVTSWEERLSLRGAAGEQDVVLNDDAVLGIEIAWASEAAVAANQAYAQGRYVDAIPLAQKVIDADGVPQWQQELLALQIVSAAMQLGDAQTAVDVYLTLLQYRLPRFAAAYLPVHWTAGQPQSIDAEAIRVAADSDWKRLIIASYGFGTSNRAAAIQTLEMLARRDLSDVAVLAKFQWYRFQPPSVLAEELDTAIRLRDRLPPALRLGPTITIADLLQRSGRGETAFAFWLEAALLSNEIRLPFASEAYGAIEDLIKPTKPDQWEKLKPLLQPQ